jgi:hypothetical protein
MAKVNDPERAVAGGSAEVTSGRLNYQRRTAGQSDPFCVEGTHCAIELVRGLALKEGTKIRLEERDRDGALGWWNFLEWR